MAKRDGGDDRNVGKRRCGQSGRGGVAGAIPQRQRVQRTGPWSAFRGSGRRGVVILYCKGRPALFIAGAAKLQAVVISNSCMVYAIYSSSRSYSQGHYSRAPHATTPVAALRPGLGPVLGKQL